MKFYGINYINDLCSLLNCTRKELFEIIQNRQYAQFTIPKKKGGYRLIESPDEKLKTTQRKIADLLNEDYANHRPKCVHGFVKHIFHVPSTKNIGVISNAKNHVAKKYVWNIDLQDFFHSITIVKVRNLFMGNIFKMERTSAEVLALLCTHNKKLAVGSPSSPVLSNFVLLNLDETLQQIANINNLTYSRYADDLTFSSNEIIRTETMSEIRMNIESNGFKLNPLKNRLKKNTQKQSVTGIKVNVKLNVDRKFKRKLRAINHDIDCNGIAAATKKYFKMKSEASKDGISKFVHAYNGLSNYFILVVNNANQKFEGYEIMN